MRKYHLNQEQQQVLLSEISVTGAAILAIEYSNPDNDQRTIRHHAYQRGRFDTLKEIYEDNFPDPLPVEDTSTQQPE